MAIENHVEQRSSTYRAMSTGTGYTALIAIALSIIAMGAAGFSSYFKLEGMANNNARQLAAVEIREDRHEARLSQLELSAMENITNLSALTKEREAQRQSIMQMNSILQVLMSDQAKLVERLEGVREDMRDLKEIIQRQGAKRTDASARSRGLTYNFQEGR